ncbi:uncharacterized protein LOC129579977 [Sitodiplosis mosellana]|uniref:uncharacterized protein LOC129579977 n=1 Tax=Sitodiplosis mosellana TaxID=263140 RepID=UPI002444846B|nr:uncharacterized protein LOC129579977 [Sitodiplosis mosellana]
MLRTIALNSKQMQLVFVLSELKTNIKLNLVGKQCHKQSRIVEFVKSLKYGENGFDLDQLAHKLNKRERDDLEDKLNRVFAVNEYAGNWNEDIYEGLILDLANNDESFNLVLQFCKENIYFAYKLINEKDSTQKDLLCIEERREEDAIFRSLMVTIMLKMCGILFKDVDPKKRPTIRTNRNFGDIYVTSANDIIYPTMPLPSLKELLVEEDNMRFDNSRWSLFKWLIGLNEESISDIRSSNDSKFIRIVSLTLTFLQLHKIISAHEANTIQQMEMERNIKTELDLPRGTSPPSKLNQRIPNINGAWVQTAHKYTIAYEMICHCLEVSGLRKETAPILFDSPEFNARMQRMESDSKPHKMLKMENF